MGNSLYSEDYYVPTYNDGKRDGILKAKNSHRNIMEKRYRRELAKVILGIGDESSLQLIVELAKEISTPLDTEELALDVRRAMGV